MIFSGAGGTGFGSSLASGFGAGFSTGLTCGSPGDWVLGRGACRLEPQPGKGVFEASGDVVLDLLHFVFRHLLFDRLAQAVQVVVYALAAGGGFPALRDLTRIQRAGSE